MANATFTIAVEDGRAFFVQRPATRTVLIPRYQDHFTIGIGAGRIMWFTRDGAGRVTTLHIGASRMRNMPFTRLPRRLDSVGR